MWKVESILDKEMGEETEGGVRGRQGENNSLQ
jgi:hypothetical protein